MRTRKAGVIGLLMALGTAGGVLAQDETVLGVVQTGGGGIYGAPTHVAVDEVRNLIYVTHYSEGCVVVIDGATGSFTKIPGVGPTLNGIAFDPVGNRIYVSAATSGLRVIDCATRSLVGSVPGPAGCFLGGVAIDPGSSRVFVPDGARHKLLVFDRANLRLEAEVPVGLTPWGAAIEPSLRRVFVANSGEGSVSVVDAATLLPVGTGKIVLDPARTPTPRPVAFNPATRRLYVGAHGSAGTSLVVIDPLLPMPGVVTYVPLNRDQMGISFNTKTNRIYVTEYNVPGYLRVLDGQTHALLATVRVGNMALGVGTNSITGRTYVANQRNDSDNVSVVQGPVPLGTYEQEVLRDAPRAWYRLDEPVGAERAANSAPTGAAYDMPWLGTVVTGEQGVQRLAAKFSGQGGGEVAPPGGIPLERDFTVEAWVRLDANNQTYQDAVAGIGTPSGGFGLGVTGDALRFTFYGLLNVDPGVRLQLGRWTHVVATLDSAAVARVYVDGVLKVASATPGNHAAWGLGIGWRPGLRDTRWLGAVDEVSIYSHALSAERVNAHYRAGLVAPPPSDTTAPSLVTSTVPPEAEGGVPVRTDVLVTLTAVDEPDGSGVKEVVYSVSGAHTLPPTVSPGPSKTLTFSAEGQTTLTAFARDQAGNASGPRSVTFVIDKTAPEIAPLPDLIVEQTDPHGAIVTFSPLVSDALDAEPVVTCDPPSSSYFPPGSTVVVCTARDRAGNVSDVRFTVTVVDTTPPGLVVRDGTFEQHDLNGTVVPLAGLVTATDLADPAPRLTFDPSDGSNFPPGSTLVTATATDAQGNAAQATFTVTVVDTLPPAITARDLVVEQASPAGTIVDFDSSIVADLADPSPMVEFSPPSGSLFGPGPTTVTVTARDRSGLEASATFTVIVQDTTPPTIVAEDLIVEQATPEGSVVTFDHVSTPDAVSPATVEFEPPSGSNFPLGVTIVTVTARDEAQNEATTTFQVIVRDTVAPTVAATNMVVEQAGPAGTPVTFDAGIVTDPTDPAPRVEFLPPSGSVFPNGDTTVTVTATDRGGNVALATFVVTVRDTLPPEIAVSDLLVDQATRDAGTPVSYSATVIDVVDAAPQVSFDPPSGSLFQPGTTTVTVTATDWKLNVRQTTFTVEVKDLSPPTFAPPPKDLVADLTSPAGGTVTFEPPRAQDVVDPAPLVECTPPSGSFFAPGVTVVTCTARDAAGNVATTTFEVQLLDRTVPILAAPTSPLNLTAPAGSPPIPASDPRVVTWLALASATDEIDPDPVVTHDAIEFPVGASTRVTFTATDDAGNTVSRSAFVIVSAVAVTIQGPLDGSVVAAGAALSYTVTGATSWTGEVSGTRTYGALTEPSGPGPWSLPGAYQVTVTVRLADGTSASATTAFVVDTVAPTVQIDSPTSAPVAGYPAGFPANSYRYGLRYDYQGARAVASAPGDLPIPVGVVASDDDGFPGDATLSLTLGQGPSRLQLDPATPSLSLELLQSRPGGAFGAHTLSAVATDRAGNSTAASVTFNVVLYAEDGSGLMSITRFTETSGKKAREMLRVEVRMPGPPAGVPAAGSVDASTLVLVDDNGLSATPDKAYAVATSSSGWSAVFLNRSPGLIGKPYAHFGRFGSKQGPLFLFWGSQGPFNRAPVAVASSASGPEDRGLPVPLLATDADGDPLSYTVVSAPAHGTLSGGAPALTYVPAANWSGSDGFEFTVSDGKETSAPALVTITIAPVNDPPTASGQVLTLPQEGQVTIPLAGSDVDGDPLSFELVTPPTLGTVSGFPAAQIVYTASPGKSGTDSFEFVARDPAGERSGVARVTIEVVPANRAPIGRDQFLKTSHDTPLPVDLGVTDPDGDPLVWTPFVAPTNGVVEGQPPLVVYRPSPGFVGQDHFSFEARDPAGAVAYGRVTVSVKAPVVLRAQGVTPQHGPRAGGTRVVVHGGGFVDAGDLEVRLGGFAASELKVLDAYRLECVTPPGVLGPADLVVKVRSTGGEVSVAEAFHYTGVEPEAPIGGPPPLGNALARQEAPVIASDGSVGFAAWRDDRSGSGDIYVSRFLGGDWEVNRRLTDDVGADQDSPALACDPATRSAVCAWIDHRNGLPEITSACSPDTGVSWTSNQLLFSSAGEPMSGPAVAADGGEAVCALVHGDRVVLLHSPDRGQSWQVAAVLSANAVVETPAVAMSQGRAACAFTAWANGSHQIVVARSADGGRTWELGPAVSDAQREDATSPAIDLDLTGSAAVCVYRAVERATLREEVRAVRSADQGRTWGTSVGVDSKPAGSARGRLTVSMSGGLVLCAFIDARDSERVHLAESHDGGQTWPDQWAYSGPGASSPSVDRTGGSWWVAYAAPGASGDVDVFVNGGRVNDWKEPFPRQRHHSVVDAAGVLHATWISGRAPDQRVFYGQSLDGGRTWTALRTLSEPSIAGRDHPRLAVSAGRLVCVWQTLVGGVPQLWLARSASGGLGWDPAVRLSSAVAVPLPEAPSLALESDRLVCAFGDARGGRMRVFAIHAVEGGSSEELQVSEDALDEARAPSVVLQGSLAVCAFEASSAALGWTKDVVVARRVDGGAWGGRARVCDDPTGATQREPALVSLGAQLVCAFRDERAGRAQVWAARSADGGASWSPNALASPPALTSVRAPSLTTEGERVACAFLAGGRVQVLVSAAGGTSWSHALVQSSAGTPSNPAGSLSAGYALVSWSMGLLDGVLARAYLAPDGDGDGLLPPFDPDDASLDSDGDGRLDAEEGMADVDGDGRLDVGVPQ